MTVKKTLETLLTTFGGTKYTSVSLSAMKEEVTRALSEAETSSPVEAAMVTKFKNKIAKMKSKENVLMAISEQMFALSGEGV